MDVFSRAREAIQRNNGELAIGRRARIDVHKLRLLVADLVQPFRNIFAGHFRLAIVNGDTAVFTKLDSRSYLKFGFETKGLALFEVDLFDVGPPDHLQFLFVHSFLKVFRQQIFEDVFAHLFSKLRSNQAGRSFPRPKSRQPYLLLNLRDDSIGLASDLVYRYGDFEFVFAAG